MRIDENNFAVVRLSLLDSRTGQTPVKSGINWGQRLGRDPNQAYLSIPVNVQKSNFFPPPGEPFFVNTDDGLTFLLVRRQANGKALQTPTNNSQIGAYIRGRIDVASGKYVQTEDLLNYGRTDMEFRKESHASYFLDFSVSKKSVQNKINQSFSSADSD